MQSHQQEHQETWKGFLQKKKQRKKTGADKEQEYEHKDENKSSIVWSKIKKDVSDG